MKPGDIALAPARTALWAVPTDDITRHDRWSTCMIETESIVLVLRTKNRFVNVASPAGIGWVWRKRLSRLPRV